MQLISGPGKVADKLGLNSHATMWLQRQHMLRLEPCILVLEKSLILIIARFALGPLMSVCIVIRALESPEISVGGALLECVQDQ